MQTLSTRWQLGLHSTGLLGCRGNVLVPSQECPPDEVVRAVAPPGAVVSPLLLSGLWMDLGGTPVVVPGPQCTVAVPYSSTEEGQLAGVVRIQKCSVEITKIILTKKYEFLRILTRSCICCIPFVLAGPCLAGHHHAIRVDLCRTPSKLSSQQGVSISLVCVIPNVPKKLSFFLVKKGKILRGC